MTAKVDTYPDSAFTGRDFGDQFARRHGDAQCPGARDFENPDDKLLPGMFATVDIDVGAPQPYVTLPQTAIAYNSYGDIAYVVEDERAKDERASRSASRSRSFVTTGETSGDQVAVLDRGQGRRYRGERGADEAPQRHARRSSTTRCSLPTIQSASLSKQ